MEACDRVGDVQRYHDDELTAEERRSFAAHLRDCPACARERQRLERLSRFLRAARPAQLPEGLRRRLRWSVNVTRERVILHTAELLAAAAGLMLAVCLGWAVLSSPPAEAAPWEAAVVNPPAETAPPIEQLIARWVVDDLSLENGHE